MERPQGRGKSRRSKAQNAIVSIEGAYIGSSGKAKPRLGDRESISDKFSEDLGQVYFFDETAATRKKRSQMPADSKKPHFKATASQPMDISDGRTPQSLM
jgi:hypothetical protein